MSALDVKGQGTLQEIAKEKSSANTARVNISQEIAPLETAKNAEKDTQKVSAKRKIPGVSGAKFGTNTRPKNAQMGAF